MKIDFLEESRLCPIDHEGRGRLAADDVERVAPSWGGVEERAGLLTRWMVSEGGELI